MNLFFYFAFLGPGPTSAKFLARTDCTFCPLHWKVVTKWQGTKALVPRALYCDLPGHPAESCMWHKWLCLLGTATPRPAQGSGTEHRPRAEHKGSRAHECDGWRSWGALLWTRLGQLGCWWVTGMRWIYSDGSSQHTPPFRCGFNTENIKEKEIGRRQASVLQGPCS